MTFDPATIVPSMRDFLQAIATQRKRLALVPLVETAEDARVLGELGVSAFACAHTGEGMFAVSAAAGTTPLVYVTPLTRGEEAFGARASGADAVILEAAEDAAAWELAAKRARSTRMAVLGNVADVEAARRIGETTAKGVYVKAPDVPQLRALLAELGASRVRVLAHLPSADPTTLRALVGVVDAAIVEQDEYLAPGFAALREEVDP